jgi:biotin carboxylase
MPARYRGVSALREYFRTNERPIYFVSPTAFNLLGINRWVRQFRYVCHYDSFDGGHPNVFVPADRRAPEFESIEDICNYLLRHPEVRNLVRANGPGGLVTFVMFDEETESLAAELGLRVAHPPAALRHRLDSKIVTTELGNAAGVPSVPNVLGRASSYPELLQLAATAGLGTDLVVQMPYGDSGKTTFFIASADDWDKAARKEPLASQDLKVMRRIEHRAIAVEAVLTRYGTLVGPLMNDITGHPELTPYRGGWAGNDYPASLTTDQKLRARELTCRLGDQLAGEGYVGFFEVDYLVDTGSGELYLGELNPRISGISPMTNVTAGAYADMPLFLFHLLEYLDIDYHVDIDEINERWSHEAAVDVWSQLILKETADVVDLLTAAPRTGVYTIAPDGRAEFRRHGLDWHGIVDETEAFYLRILAPGDFRYKGADLGAIVTRGRLQSDDNRLERRCVQWIDGIRGHFAGMPVVPLQAQPTAREPFKMA